MNYTDIIFLHKLLSDKIECTELLNKIYFQFPLMITRSKNTALMLKTVKRILS